VVNLLSDDEMRSSMKIRLRARAEKLCWEAISRQILDYYINVLEGRTIALRTVPDTAHNFSF
jgi:hypothetical protein